MVDSTALRQAAGLRRDSWTILWCTTLPHSVWNSSPFRGGTWTFPLAPEHSVQWISSTTLTGLPPHLTEQDNNHQTLKFEHQALVQDPMNGDYILFYFHYFPCFFLFLSISLYLTLPCYWFSIWFAPRFGQMHFSNNFNIWVIILLRIF